MPFINDSLTTLAVATPEPIPLDSAGLERGYAYHQLLKTDEFSRIGSRYVVAVEPFNALAKSKFEASAGASEQLMGAEQRAWFLKTMTASTRTFKIWGNEVCFMPRHIDLSPVTLAPEALRIKIAISAEDWDGFPNERDFARRASAPLGVVVIVPGDLHCFFAGMPLREQLTRRNAFGRVRDRQFDVDHLAAWLFDETWLARIRLAPPRRSLIAASVGTLLVDPDTRPQPAPGLSGTLSDNGYGIFRGERRSSRCEPILASHRRWSRQRPDAIVQAPSQNLFAQRDFEVVAWRAGSIPKQCRRARTLGHLLP